MKGDITRSFPRITVAVRATVQYGCRLTVIYAFTCFDLLCFAIERPFVCPFNSLSFEKGKRQ